MTHPIYHLDMRVAGCAVQFRVNDLPLGELSSVGPNKESFAPPMNPYLVGQNNMVEVHVRPVFDPSGEPVDLSGASIEGAVVRAQKDEPVGPGEGDQITTFSFADELRERIRQAVEDEEELELPQMFVHLFDNDVVSFEAELRDAEPFDDEDALRDYAIVIRDLVAAGDSAGLAAQMEAKVQAYAVAYDAEDSFIRDSLVESLRDTILPAGPVTDFERDDVQLEALGGGRVWELRRPNGRPLVSTDPDPEGGSFQIPILVAPRDGGLQVVR